MQLIKFIREFLKHPKEVGAVAESSVFLARKMARQMEGATNVIEFGSGTGSVTTEILRHLPQNGKLTCFEINPYFCDQLKAIKDPRLTVINDDVQNYEKYVQHCDCILSCLPLRIFDEAKRENIIALSSKSKTYVQFQYSPFLRTRLKKYFNDVKVKFVPLNIPPAFVYISKNPKSQADHAEFADSQKA